MAPPASGSPMPYFMGATVAATVNFPLWKASAIGQSGFKTPSGLFSVYVDAFKPPYKGAAVVVSGMAWARAAIFYGSDLGRRMLTKEGCPALVASGLPPLVCASLVQVVNQPAIRASITLQDPSAKHKGTWEVVKMISRRHGVAALWHGLSAGILKTVPKYCTAIMAKDLLEERLPRRGNTPQDELLRSAVKSSLAGVAGAAITNPFDVIRNEMFKTNMSLEKTIKSLVQNEPNFATRGLAKNIVAVSIPIAITIFLTDAFTKMTTSDLPSFCGPKTMIGPISLSDQTHSADFTYSPEEEK